MVAFYRIYQAIMKIAAYALPWREPYLLEGEGCVLELPQRIVSRGIKNVLLVTGHTIMSLDLPKPLILALKAAGIHVTVYKTVPDPTIENVEEALSMYNEHNCGGIIAFGGGSPIDCAKAVGARVARPNKPIAKMRGLLKVLKRLPPLFAIPTTAGAGSEATVAAVIKDNRTHVKYALMDPALIPLEAILDPLLTGGLPPFVTATTGMDALTHAVEAYIGRSNTGETRKMALLSTKLIFDNLYTTYTQGSNIQARANMQRAAYYAGVAFTRAYVGNVHAISHTLGGTYGIPHGLANAVVLPYVLEDYGERVHKQLAELANAAGIANEHGDGSCVHAEKAAAFIKAVRDLNARMGIPDKIPEIKEKDIPTMAKQAHKEANPTYPVPCVFSVADFERIYRLVARGRGMVI